MSECSALLRRTVRTMENKYTGGSNCPMTRAEAKVCLTVNSPKRVLPTLVRACFDTAQAPNPVYRMQLTRSPLQYISLLFSFCTYRGDGRSDTVQANRIQRCPLSRCAMTRTRNNKTENRNNPTRQRLWPKLFRLRVKRSRPELDKKRPPRTVRKAFRQV